jgi:hypothetical protein
MTVAVVAPAALASTFVTSVVGVGTYALLSFTGARERGTELAARRGLRCRRTGGG